MDLDPTPIRRCVCGDVTFLELREAEVRTLEEGQGRFGVALHCQTCVPYILAMLRTGQTKFSVEPLDEGC